MKKSICLILSTLIILSTVLVACSSNSEEETTKKGKTDTTAEAGLDSAENEFVIATVDVTDKNGEKVTDKNGEVVTTDVYLQYKKDKDGNTVAVEIDDNGEPVTDKNGEEVTHSTETGEFATEATTKPTTNKQGETQGETASLPKQPTTKPTTASTTMTTEKIVEPTSSELTTLAPEQEKVPTTSDTGKVVSVSNEDQQIIKSMLEVPYLYLSSYENADGVPIDIATHTAIWMAQRENFNTTSYASATIVLDLFKYYAQTVVNFKTYCNDAKNDNITYKSTNDTFIISSFEAPTHSVKLDKIEYLGNNNYYKVTGTVSGTNKAKKVVAVIQKNRLDSSLGFSVKALKWS